MSAILKFEFQKKENSYIFQKKIIQTTQKDTILNVTNYIFPKTRANTNMQWTHYSALKSLIDVNTLHIRAHYYDFDKN